VFTTAAVAAERRVIIQHLAWRRKQQMSRGDVDAAISRGLNYMSLEREQREGSDDAGMREQRCELRATRLAIPVELKQMNRRAIRRRVCQAR
jgi:hypothetical protein